MSAGGKRPYLTTAHQRIEIRKTPSGPVAGLIDCGPNLDGWGWTVGLGWHIGLPSVGAALDALLADPAFGVDVHGEGRPSDRTRSDAGGEA